jgi:hypothetical protein
MATTNAASIGSSTRRTRITERASEGECIVVVTLVIDAVAAPAETFSEPRVKLLHQVAGWTDRGLRERVVPTVLHEVDRHEASRSRVGTLGLLRVVSTQMAFSASLRRVSQEGTFGDVVL